jgi:fermentation-respiration switch protein FrsA (DUF1100 family)
MAQSARDRTEREAADLRRRLDAVEGQVARLTRRVESMGGELRAALRQATAAEVSPVEVVKRAEAAAVLGQKPSPLAAWARDGRGPAYHLRGNRAWYRVADLVAWREAAEKDAPAGPRRPGADEAPAFLPGVS